MSTLTDGTPSGAGRHERRGTAVVVGASLASLLTGLSLSRAGYDITMLERSGPSPRSGAALGINGDACGGTRLPAGSDGAARSLWALASGGSASPVQAWSAVHARLRAAAEADPRIELRHDTAVTGVGQDDDAAWATTSTGRTLRADVVVGADGHRSVVRRGVAPDKPEATFAGYVLWLGIADEAAVPAARRLPRGHDRPDILDAGDFCLIGYPLPGEDGSLAPGARRLGWAWFDPTRNDLLREKGCVVGDVVRRSLRFDAVPDHTYRELAAAARDLWPAPWQDAILDRVERRAVIGTPIAEYVPDRLVNGRLALVGNAAHVQTPMTGMGFDASLQDAEALADHLAGTSEVRAALRGYEETRLHGARDLVRSGQQFSRSFAGGGH
ncbi:FAD-dependent monooxygenase [Streptomyces sp. 2-6]|uniref:FAD-dependent monooxygenase n=1 Tax=Streptomyces sp. 2-6 TaxID=2978333 RepID=UPI003D13F6C3